MPKGAQKRASADAKMPEYILVIFIPRFSKIFAVAMLPAWLRCEQHGCAGDFLLPEFAFRAFSTFLLGLALCYPTLAAKTKTPQGWGTQTLHDL
jgi:hypothetical protein